MKKYPHLPVVWHFPISSTPYLCLPHTGVLLPLGVLFLLSTSLSSSSSIPTSACCSASSSSSHDGESSLSISSTVGAAAPYDDQDFYRIRMRVGGHLGKVKPLRGDCTISPQDCLPAQILWQAQRGNPHLQVKISSNCSVDLSLNSHLLFLIVSEMSPRVATSSLLLPHLRRTQPLD